MSRWREEGAFTLFPNIISGMWFWYACSTQPSKFWAQCQRHKARRDRTNCLRFYTSASNNGCVVSRFAASKKQNDQLLLQSICCLINHVNVERKLFNAWYGARQKFQVLVALLAAPTTAKVCVPRLFSRMKVFFESQTSHRLRALAGDF
jgi:hypothetical protein